MLSDCIPGILVSQKDCYILGNKPVHTRIGLPVPFFQGREDHLNSPEDTLVITLKAFGHDPWGCVFSLCGCSKLSASISLDFKVLIINQLKVAWVEVRSDLLSSNHSSLKESTGRQVGW